MLDLIIVPIRYFLEEELKPLDDFPRNIQNWD